MRTGTLRSFGLLAPLALIALPAAFAAASGGQPDRPASPFQGIYSRAEVEGPRGRFVTEIVSLADGRVRFLQVHPDRRIEILLLPDAALERVGDVFAPAPAGTSGFVRSHDVQRVILAGGGDVGATLERLEVEVPAELGGGKVEIELGDRRPVHGFTLPFAATFVHGGERHAYRYIAVLPFRLAPGAALPDDPAALFERLGDLAGLAAAHERVMEAHRRSDAALLLEGDGEIGVSSRRGELVETRRTETLERLRGYLGAIRFSRYADTELPVVAVSADGTLGWLACEIEAEGIRSSEGREEPIAYAFSWVELYARDGGSAGGRWLAVGNASSERP